MNDTEFIQHLIDMCVEVRARMEFARNNTTRMQGQDFVRTCVRVAHGLCSMYDMRPSDVDRRLVEREFVQ